MTDLRNPLLEELFLYLSLIGPVVAWRLAQQALGQITKMEKCG